MEKTTIIGLVCGCLILSLTGVLSTSWLVDSDEFGEYRQGLRERHWDSLVEIGVDERVEGSESLAAAENSTCSTAKEFRSYVDDGFQEEFYEEYAEMFEMFCSELKAQKYAGYTATALLIISSFSGVAVLVRVFRELRTDSVSFTSVGFDSRLVLLSGGVTTATPLIWRILVRDSFGSSAIYSEWSLGWGFFMTLIGGLLGLIAFGLIYRSGDLSGIMARLKEDKAVVKEKAFAHHQMKVEKLAAEQQATKEAILLQESEVAVRAKINAEKNPKDPLGWLLMAEAMEKANRPEEAMRGRRIAMELIEGEEE